MFCSYDGLTTVTTTMTWGYDVFSVTDFADQWSCSNGYTYYHDLSTGQWFV